MNELQKLPKIIHHCMTLGEIPTSYKASLSYAEQLTWFCNFLETQVIPVVNDNSQVVQELQTFITNYFDNLDVQDEINNKLEAMAESGELEEIIAQYVNLSSVLAYDTLNDLLNATNIVDGSFARTYGKVTYNDGKGAFYKIREITNQDVIDNIVLFAIITNNQLVAEKMPDYEINSINNEIDFINSNKTIFIGDSYGAGTTAETSTIDSWIDYLIENEYTDSYKYAINGAGFSTGTTKFIDLLNEAITDITDKSSIKQIVVAGGFNDRSSSISQIKTDMTTFVNAAKTNFPNAKIYVGMIGGCSIDSTTGTNYRLNTFNVALPAYQYINNLGGYYLTGSEYVLKDYSLLSTDGYHPNENGYKQLAIAISQILKGQGYKLYSNIANITTGNDHLAGNVIRLGDVTTIDINGYIDYNSVSTGHTIDLGSINTSNYYRPVVNYLQIPARFEMQTSNSKYYGGVGIIELGTDGHARLKVSEYRNDGTDESQGILISQLTRLYIYNASATIPTILS